MAKKKKKRPSLDEILKSFRFIVGFDPSLDGTGYAVLDCRFKEPRIAEMGVVKGRTATWAADTPHQVKLALIRAKALELRSKYDPIFPMVFFERGFTKFNNSTQATFKARGALESELVGLVITEFPPSEVKKITTGHGASGKDSVAEVMAEIFGISVEDFETEDVSDALAVAYAGYLEYYKGEN
jgi:crossover junction endodeoxyribonuclease RuvC